MNSEKRDGERRTKSTTRTEGEMYEPKGTKTKPCKVCGETIKAVARICYHCSNYQDWRSEFNLGSAVLTSLVAVLAVLGVIVPIATTVVTPKNSELLFSYLGSTAESISVLATNNGIRPGAVRYPVALQILPSKDAKAPDATVNLQVINKQGSAALVVDAGKSAAIDLRLGPPVPERVDNKLLGRDVCMIEIESIAFKAAAAKAHVPVDCSEFRKFIEQLDREIDAQHPPPRLTTPPSPGGP
jgi:hypothetical protein